MAMLSHLTKQKLSTKKQQNISVRSTTSNIVTTLDDDKSVSSSVADEKKWSTIIKL
jgi:hypothetical protein